MIGVTGRVVSRHLKRLACSLAAGAVIAGSGGVPTALAQSADSIAGLTQVEQGAPLLLEANELVYDNDRKTVAAVGDVRIDYGGTKVVADRVVYRQLDKRLLAIGNVEIIQPDRTKVYADEIDITDDFRDGFVNALRIVTPDKTYFAAESAQREGGDMTTFNNGVYTACEPCREHPEKPPIWQIKARTIIWNGEEKTVRFEKATFEFFGHPIAYLPFFTTADPTVKRKSGFLMPGFDYSEELGFGVSIPYFMALAPNYDLTVTGTGYTRQGFLGQAEFRHRLENGIYNLKAAGIHQMNPSAFDEVGLATVDESSVNRGMIGSKGDFKINPRWSFGWNVLAQTDKNFARTYSIEGFDKLVQTNEVYLTGLHDRNIFDLRFMKFDIQEDYIVKDARARDDEQPWVLPSLDYTRVTSEPVAGGELTLNVNARGIERESTDFRNRAGSTNFATRGVEGFNSRITAETEWKRTYVAPGGLAFTPILAAQGDAIHVDSDVVGSGAVPLSTTTPAQLSASLLDDGLNFDGSADYYRGMVTAGLEARWPLLFTAPGSSHIIEPVAQVFVRPNEMYAGLVPNEDAQSFVFDATNLFDRDKFSGYDRVEGGHRANVGLRYTGSFNNGWSLHSLFGQSYHLGGENPFTSPDLVNAGAESGLETDVSDYVGMIGADYRSRYASALRGRFDQDTFEVKRAEAELSYRTNALSFVGSYAYSAAQPAYGFGTDRHEAKVGASVLFRDYWRVTGGVTYDIENQRLAKNVIGLAYDDECFGIGLTYTQTRDSVDAVRQSVGLRLSFRTLGDIGGGDNLALE